MKPRMKFPRLIGLIPLIVFASVPTNATSPRLREAVRINSMELIGSPLKDNTVELRVLYTAHVNSEGRLHLICQGEIKPQNAPDAELGSDEHLTLVAGQTVERRIALSVKEAGASHISVSITLLSPISGYSLGDSRYLNVESTSEEYRIFDDSGVNPSAIRTVMPHFAEDNPLKGRNGPTQFETTYNVFISGKIEFYDQSQLRNRGLYGNTVQLWFRNTAYPNELYHPVYKSNCLGIYRTHYCIVDEYGSYYFNFVFTGDLSAYNQALVIVSRDNAAASMPLQDGGFQVWCVSSGSYTDWFSLSEAVQEPINGSNPNITLTNASRSVNGQDGAIFRNMMLAREFVVQRYSGAPPFGTQPIYCVRTNLGPGTAGRFVPIGYPGIYPRIEIDHGYTWAKTTMHEFGHYMNYKMWNNLMGPNQDIAEGWAVFYSMAARNYADRTYGDDLLYYIDEGELSPFTNPRFSTIPYALENPDIARFACYLWNVYDESSDGPFESSFYHGDNDDISGLQGRVFEVFRGIGPLNPNYHWAFIDGLAADLVESLNKVFVFMYETLPGVLMRPGQISNVDLTTVSSQEIRFDWVNHHYGSGYLLPAANSPNEYRVYKNTGGNWNLVQTVAFGGNSAAVNSTDPRGQYMITASNSSGNSYAPPVVSVLAIALEVAHYIEPGSGGTYKVNGNPVGASWLKYSLLGEQINIEAVPPDAEWIFVQWSDGNAENPRNITPTEHTTLYATFKMRLASTLSIATSSNSQRVLSANGFVYESASSVWCGYRGAGEVRASNGSASAPSLVPCGDNLYFVYRNNSSNQIMYADANFPWYTPLPIGSVTSPDARPVIAELGGYFHVFWKGATDIRYNSGVLWSWGTESSVGGTGGCGNPSVSSTASEMYVTYDNGDDVFIFDHPNYLYAGEVPASVAPASHGSQVCAEDGEQAHVVWEAFGPFEWGQRVMYQHVAKGYWDAAHEFRCSSPTVDFQNPTVSSSGSPVWAWDDGSSTYKAEYEGATWTLSEVYPDITQPNFATGGTTFISTSTSGPPYRLVMVDETTAGPRASASTEQYTRRVVVARKPSRKVRGLRQSAVGDSQNDPDSSSFISVELSPLSLKMRDGSIVPVEFAAVADSVRDERSVWQSLASQPVLLPSGIDSILISGEANAVEPHRLAGAELGLSFDLVDADRGTVLKRIGSEQIFTGSGRGSLVQRERLVGVVGRRVFMRPSIRGFAGRSANLVSTVVHVHTLLVDSTSNPVSPLAKVGENQSTLPTEYTLHQNYPNPFNPTTEIKFDLPEAGNVSLVVYDVLGKKVAELADGHYEAGYHSAKWNASGQASGVYFARFVASDASGNIRLSKVNKLALTK